MLRLLPRIGEEGDLAPLAAYPETLARLLFARGARTEADAEAFLNPKLEALHDPFLMQGMAEAVSAIREAMAKGARIAVYGDYDVDGVCATAILLEALRGHGANASFYIPSRHDEGYGLNEGAVRKLAEEADLLITVDCGINAVEEVALARTLGLSVIVTDHHEPRPVLPDAVAVLDPLLGDYPLRRLCGAGVAFKLAQALFGLDERLLDLAALATVADMVPLLDENRVLAHHGLSRMRARAGLRALIAESGLGDKILTAGHLGFQIAPRINAGGRLADASRGVRLLLTQDEREAAEIARALDTDNAERQQLEAEIIREATAQAEEGVDFLRERVVIAKGSGWNTGVVGLAASRLAERFSLPSIVLSEADGVCVGSARSVPGVNLFETLTRCDDLFLRVGGHAQAAGMTIRAEYIPALRDRLNAILAGMDEEIFLPCAPYDLPLSLSEATVPLCGLLDRLAPFGLGNPAPVFLVKGARVTDARCVGRDGKHLKLRLAQENATLDGIAFGLGDALRALPETVDALATLSVNEWMGRASAQLEVTRLLPADPAHAFLAGCEARREDFGIALIADPTPAPAADFAAVAEALRASRQGTRLVVRTVEGARLWVKRLEEAGLADRLDFCFGKPPDTRPFNALCALMEGGGGWVLDGDLVPRALARFSPSDDALRGLYRALRGGAFTSLEALASAANLPLAGAALGLLILKELELIEYGLVPFAVTLLPMRKRDLRESRTLCRVRDAIAREER